MKPLQNILACTMLVLAQYAMGQEQASAKLPLDPATNCQLRYYYYPNLEAYFDNQTSVFIYKDKGEWKKEKQIPSGYRGYGLFNKAHIALDDYDDDEPQQFLEKHKKRFPYNSLRRMRGHETASVE